MVEFLERTRQVVDDIHFDLRNFRNLRLRCCDSLLFPRSTVVLFDWLEAITEVHDFVCCFLSGTKG